MSIVDDDESVRLSIASLVRSLGVDARSFPSASSFLCSDAAALSACIVCDIDMPLLNGLDMQSVLRERGNSTPLIFVTATANGSQRSTAMSNGAICFLEKPVDAQAIEEALALVFKARSNGGKKLQT